MHELDNKTIFPRVAKHRHLLGTALDIKVGIKNGDKDGNKGGDNDGILLGLILGSVDE